MQKLRFSERIYGASGLESEEFEELTSRDFDAAY